MGCVRCRGPGLDPDQVGAGVATCQRVARIPRPVRVDQDRQSHREPESCQRVWDPGLAEKDDVSCAEDAGEGGLVGCTDFTPFFVFKLQGMERRYFKVPPALVTYAIQVKCGLKSRRVRTYLDVCEGRRCLFVYFHILFFHILLLCR